MIAFVLSCIGRQLLNRGGGRYEKLVLLSCMNLTKNVGGAEGCILGKLPKVGAAIAEPAPPVLPPLLKIDGLSFIIRAIFQVD